MTGSTETVQRENIVETRHTITGLEYDTEYEVKLFAVNKQGDSEPDVRTFKTKSGMYLYLRLPTLLSYFYFLYIFIYQYFTVFRDKVKKRHHFEQVYLRNQPSQIQK